MELYVLYAIVALTLISIIMTFIFRWRPQSDNTAGITQELQKTIERLEQAMKSEFRTNREEAALAAKTNRDELTKNQKDFVIEQKVAFGEFSKRHEESADKTIKTIEKIAEAIQKTIEKELRSFQDAFSKNVDSFNTLQREKFAQLENKQTEMIKNTEDKLNVIKQTVAEKLEKTLAERLGQSFETVGKQLIEVQRGLGEMQVLAQDVGGLKRVLSNVKMRGGIGEVQLGALLEQMLAPEQFEANVKTKRDSDDLVEFAVKLPGKSADAGPVWIPIDAKFPKDVYDTLLDAHEKGDPGLIERAQKDLDTTVKKMAKDISEKYLDPPNTTDFAIMFLPFEGIFAEVSRKSALIADLHRNYKIMVTGPTTLASILYSLQMGFKTLAIEKRSSEVWQVLGAVKKEFENFGNLMQKAQSNIQTGLNQLDDVMGKRTRAIQRRLRTVESLSDTESRLVLSTGAEGEFDSVDD